MFMLPHHFETQLDSAGEPMLVVCLDVTPAQARAAAHAVRVAREARYRPVELSADDVLTMREMTALADDLADIGAGTGTDRLAATVARLGLLRAALDEHAAGEHLEREGDAEARPVVIALVDAVAELHAEAVRAALAGPGVAV